MNQTTDTAGEQPEVVISVHDLLKQFPARDGSMVTVLDGISFDVYGGETIVLMGGSGCGKSTLLNCLIGEYTPEGGRILYKTHDMAAAADMVPMDENQLNEIRKKFGILFQSGALFNSMALSHTLPSISPVLSLRRRLR